MFRWYCAFNNVKRGEWTYEEDRAIWLHVQEHGPGEWARLARGLQHRTDNAVMQRYKRLEKWKYLSQSLPEDKVRPSV